MTGETLLGNATVSSGEAVLVEVGVGGGGSKWLAGPGVSAMVRWERREEGSCGAGSKGVGGVSGNGQAKPGGLSEELLGEELLGEALLEEALEANRPQPRIRAHRPNAERPFKVYGDMWERMLIFTIEGVDVLEDCVLSMHLAWFLQGTWPLDTLFEAENCEWVRNGGCRSSSGSGRRSRRRRRSSRRRGREKSRWRKNGASVSMLNIAK